jgi:predicted nucleotidyltransferase
MKDEKINLIKFIISSIIPKNQIILFGSRAKGNYINKSDYDLLVVVPQKIDVCLKINLASQITKKLAENKISADVIIESAQEIELKKNLIGNVIRSAVREGCKI